MNVPCPQVSVTSTDRGLKASALFKLPILVNPIDSMLCVQTCLIVVLEDAASTFAICITCDEQSRS